MKSDSTDRPAKISVRSMLASHGSAVARTSTRLIASSRSGWAMPSTRSVSCRIHSVASAWIPRLIQNANPRRNADRRRTPWSGWAPGSLHTSVPDSRRYPIGAADSRSKRQARATSRGWRWRRSRPTVSRRCAPARICVLMRFPPRFQTIARNHLWNQGGGLQLPHQTTWIQSPKAEDRKKYIAVRHSHRSAIDLCRLAQI